MTDTTAPPAAPVNRRRFLRSAATTAGAVALIAPPVVAETGEPRRLAESPACAAAWERFQRRLAEVLPDLSEDEYLIITRKQTNQFVQFAAQGQHGMRVEAVGNEFLSASAQLSDESIASLVAMGWHAPTYALTTKPADEDEPADGSPNFYLDAATPVPFGELAALAVRTLREIHRISHPGWLEYATLSADEGLSIRFPSLGIKRASGR
jgi:type III secretion system-like peptide-binding chaperone